MDPTRQPSPVDDTPTILSPKNDEGFSTPMPSHQEITLEIENSYGHMEPPPPSALALKNIKTRKRLDAIWGDTVFDDDDTTPVDFSNQGCSRNSRFIDKGLSQQWRDHNPNSDNSYGTQIIQANKLITIPQPPMDVFNHYPQRSVPLPLQPSQASHTTPSPSFRPLSLLPPSSPPTIPPPFIPPKPTRKSISELRGKQVSTSDMAHILTAYNEKYGINQIDFDDMSFDSPFKAAHWAKLKDHPNSTARSKKPMAQWKATQKMLNEPRKIDLDDESSFEEEIPSTIPIVHKLRLLESSDDNSENLDQNSINDIDSNSNSVPSPLLNLTNDSTINDELRVITSPLESCQYPPFWADIIERDIEPKELNALVKTQNWITDSLQLEIDHNSPQACDKSYNIENNEETFSQSSFTSACNKVFYQHRQFCHHIQLYQFATAFLQAWNVYRSHNGGCVFCCYSESISLTIVDDDNNLHRKASLTTELKKKIKCPFKIQ